MAVTDIVIPVRDQLHLTQSIVNQLTNMQGWNHCWIFDNGSKDNTWSWLREWCDEHPRFSRLPAEGETIYSMWDWGYNCARFSDHVLFLNNDVALHPATIIALNNALDTDDTYWIAYPDYDWRDQNGMLNLCNFKVTQGTYRHGGMSGYCFMLKTKKVDWSPLVDPRFIHWGGDDDIAFEVEARGGRQVRVVGLPIEHMNEGTARHFDLGAQKAADLKAVIEKWGR